MLSTQLVVIGAGPGGYTAAFRAADLGLGVTLINNTVAPGGICLHEGCIPSKTILHAAKLIAQLDSHKSLFEISEMPRLDHNKLRAHQEKIVSKLASGLGILIKQRKINYIQGQAKLLNSHTAEISKPDGSTETISFEKMILASGSRPATLPVFNGLQRVWNSSDALRLPSIPANLLVVGGGSIGLELGTAYAALGSQITLLDALPVLLPNADKDLVDVLMRRLRKSFRSIMTGTQILKAEETAGGVHVILQDPKGQERPETYDQVLVSVGRKPNTESLGLENTQIQLTDTGFIEVDDQRRTDDKNIFAIGDLTGQPMLAHKASLEGKVAAEVIAGHNSVYDPHTIPSVVYTDPEIAWCGLSEMQALNKNLEITVSRFPWAASGRALTIDRPDGLTKIIADKKSGRLLGIGIVGCEAGELIAEATLAVETGLKAEDLSLTVHPHPTLSETLLEATEGLFGRSIHFIKPPGL